MDFHLSAGGNCCIINQSKTDAVPTLEENEMTVEIDLAGKVAVVTGGASGIGAAVVDLLAKAGADCVVVDRAGTDLPVDVSDEEQVVDFFRNLEYVRPHIDLLVTCAGITDDDFITKMTAEQFDRVLAVNLRGTFLCVREAAKHMATRGGGSIVTISSISANGNLGQANYAASKAGVIALSRTAALELARDNIRVNTICPGPVDTPMLATVPDKVRESFIKQTPARKLATPENIADLVLFLASDRSSHITGEVMTVSGGLHF